MKYLLALLSVCLLCGCKTPKLEPDGAYKGDLNLALADASYKFAYETTIAVFQFELENRAELWKVSPSIKHGLDKLRPEVVKVDKRWAIARRAYKANPTPQGLSNLQTILAEIQRLLPAVQSQLQPLN